MNQQIYNFFNQSETLYKYIHLFNVINQYSLSKYINNS